MNMLKKGPDIKLSDLKVPDFLSDLYYDLKDRHLLPLVVLLIIAIVAVPIALSQSGGEEEVDSATGPALASPSTATSASAALVAKSAPGLRDYRKRLSRMRAENPFRQQYTEAEVEGASSGSSESSGEESLTSEEPIPTEPSPPTSGPDGEPTNPANLTYFSYAIDVRIVPGGSQDGGSGGEAQVRRNLPELTMLPSRETPAAIYMGSTKDGKKALMMVSSNVEAIFGDGKCVLGSDSCQLLAMEPGVPETFVYGGEGRAFKIELLKVHLVATDKLNRAPLGKPKKRGKSDNGGQFRPR